MLQAYAEVCFKDSLIFPLISITFFPLLILTNGATFSSKMPEGIATPSTLSTRNQKVYSNWERMNLPTAPRLENSLRRQMKHLQEGKGPFSGYYKSE